MNRIVSILFVGLSFVCSTNGQNPVKDTIDSLSKILNVDIEKMIGDTLDYHDSDLKTRIEISWERFNFSSKSGENRDYLVTVHFKAKYYRESTTLIYGFVQTKKSFNLAFFWEGSDRCYGTIPKLLDIDSDSRKEILIEADYARHQSTLTHVDIWRYTAGRFDCIFSQDLIETYLALPYWTENKYAFKKNKTNAKLLDIQLNVQFFVDDYAVDDSTWSAYMDSTGIKPIHPVSFHKSYLFTFNGIKYIPNKSVRTYRKFFDRYFGKSD